MTDTTVVSDLIATRQAAGEIENKEIIDVAFRRNTTDTLAELTKDRMWIDSAKNFYLSQHGMPFEGSDEDVVRYGLDAMTELHNEFNDPATPLDDETQSIIASKIRGLGDLNDDEKASLFYLMQTYQDKDPVVTAAEKMFGQSVSNSNFRDVGRYSGKQDLLGHITDYMAAVVGEVYDFGKLAATPTGWAWDIAKAIPPGVLQGAQGLLDIGYEIDEALFGYHTPNKIDLSSLPFYKDSDSLLGSLAQGLTQFMTVFAGSGGLGGSTVRMLGAGALADASFDPEHGSLSTFLREIATDESYGKFHTVFKWLNVDNAVTEFFDSKVDEDADAVERLKARLLQAGEGTLITAFGPFIKQLRRMRNEGAGPVMKEYLNEIETRVDKFIPPPGQLNMGFGPVPEGTRGHNLPPVLLVTGDGSKAITPVPQAWGPQNERTFANMDAVKANNPDPLASNDAWVKFWQEAAGGDALPAPPYQLIKYKDNPHLVASKLAQLRPELKEAVDEGFKHLEAIGSIYKSGAAKPEHTGNLFAWAFLSRGAGPFQQEGAYVDLLDFMQPYIAKAMDGTFSKADLKAWKKQGSKLIPTGSPGRSVIHNINALGDFFIKAGVPIESEGGKSALAVMHQLLLDPSLSSAQIRRRFFDVAAGSGMDAKVLSFALLSRKDVVVLDRIQGRHLWDDGTFEGKNIYDGIPKITASGNTKGEGLAGILAGPRAVAIYEMIEEGMADTVQQAYKILGREGDASLARFHWESWVIDGNQAVDHGSLRAVYDPNLPGAGRVQEGKPNTFAHGAVYMRVGDDTVVLYQTSDGQSFQFSPQDFDKFTKSISKKSKSNDIIPKDFKVTVDANGNPRTEAWFNDPEVNRNALDDAVRKFGREWDGPNVSSTRGFVETDTSNIGRKSWQQYADQRGAAQ